MSITGIPMSQVGFPDYVLMFFIYSAIGWCIESTYCSLGDKRINNRGFLYGPLCPIYGTASLVLTLCIYFWSQPIKERWWLVIIAGMILADIVEYLTSYLMEKLFHARWWDYTTYFLNLHGRICFQHTLYWGLASFIFIYLVQPHFFSLLFLIDQPTRYTITAVVLCVFTIDLGFTVSATVGVTKLTSGIERLRSTLNVTAQAIRGAADEAFENISDSVSEGGRKFAEKTQSLNDSFNVAGRKLSERTQDINDEFTRRHRRVSMRTHEINDQFSDLVRQFEELVGKRESTNMSEKSRKIFNDYGHLHKDTEQALRDLENLIAELKEKLKNDENEKY